MEWLIHTKVKCNTCKGKQIIKNPNWQQYMAWHEECGPDHPKEPWKIPCKECDGKGWIEYWMSMDEFIKEMNSKCYTQP